MSKKIALVTGASSGLGLAMALRFRSEGFVVIGVCRHRPGFELDRWIEADITTEEGRHLIDTVIKHEFGGIDVLINNAGKGSYATWEEMPEDDLRALFELNFFAPVLLTGKLLPWLEKTRGTVINITSVAGKMHVPCMGAYCATKAAYNLFSDSLRPEIQRRGIRVLTVMPGRINTGFSSRALGNRTPPETPRGGNIDRFPAKVFNAYRKGARQLVFPGWYRLIMLLPKLIPALYDKKNIQLWRL